jgi:hypothetical protein
MWRNENICSAGWRRSGFDGKMGPPGIRASSCSKLPETGVGAKARNDSNMAAVTLAVERHRILAEWVAAGIISISIVREEDG